MQWRLCQGDILEVPADVLVCSANVYLNLSGGVGGSFLLRYGPAMQEGLQQYLAERNVRHAEPGDVIAMPPFGSPYRAVLHAVAVNALYESSPELVRSVVSKSLELAATVPAATSVALPALACGFGRLSMQDFANAVLPLIDRDYSPLQSIILCVRTSDDLEELLQTGIPLRH